MLPSVFTAAKALLEETMLETLPVNLLATAEESPPTASSPQVCTLPSEPIAAKANPILTRCVGVGITTDR